MGPDFQDRGGEGGAPPAPGRLYLAAAALARGDHRPGGPGQLRGPGGLGGRGAGAEGLGLSGEVRPGGLLQPGPGEGDGPAVGPALSGALGRSGNQGGHGGAGRLRLPEAPALPGPGFPGSGPQAPGGLQRPYQSPLAPAPPPGSGDLPRPHRGPTAGDDRGAPGKACSTG